MGNNQCYDNSNCIIFVCSNAYISICISDVGIAESILDLNYITFASTLVCKYTVCICSYFV